MVTRKWPPTAGPTPSHGLVGPCSKAARDTRPRQVGTWRTRELLPDGSPSNGTANRSSGSMPGTELKVRKLVGNGTIRKKASNGSANTKDSVLKRYRWNLLKRELTSASSNLHRTPIECSAAHTLLNRNTCAEKNDKPRKLRKAVCLRSKY